MFWFGVIVGYVLAIFGSAASDNVAVKNKIVKLNGKYYSIIPLFEEDEHHGNM